MDLARGGFDRRLDYMRKKSNRNFESPKEVDNALDAIVKRIDNEDKKQQRKSQLKNFINIFKSLIIKKK